MAEQNNAAEEEAILSGVAATGTITIPAGGSASVVVPHGGHRTLIVQPGTATTTIEVEAR